MLQFSSISRFNTLYWISSLAADEVGVTDRIVEDLEAHCERKGLPFERYDPKNAKEFIACLDNIIGRTKAGSLPMIHLDLHGSAKDGVLISQSGEYVSWERVARKLRDINILSKNNLCVISGACFSFEIVREVNTKLPAPFFLLLAPPEEIEAGILEENTVNFYQDIINNEDIVASYKRYFGRKMAFFHCERMVAIVLAKYIDTACKGKNASDRREYLLSSAISNGARNNRHNRRAIRFRVRKMTKPSDGLIERFVDSFLIGKRPNYTIKELNSFVDEARMSGKLSPRAPFSWEALSQISDDPSRTENGK